MISKISIMDRLKLLGQYMDWFVDRWPLSKNVPFGQFIYLRHRHMIPGTPEHAKAIATHCYYCFQKFTPQIGEDVTETCATIDHFEPSSKFKTQKFVICCAKCNMSKGNVAPDRLEKILFKAQMNGGEVWGFSGKKLKQLSDRIISINKDRLWNTGPNVYYIKK